MVTKIVQGERRADDTEFSLCLAQSSFFVQCVNVCT